MHRLAFSLFSLCCLNVVGSQNLFPDPKLLSEKIKDLVEVTLKRSEMQEHLDSFAYVNEDLGEDKLNQIISFIGKKIQEQTKALLNLQKAAALAYSSSEAFDKTTSCCDVSDEKFSSKFLADINRDIACVWISSNAPQYPLAPSETIFGEASKEIAKNFPSTKWQFFGTEDALVVFYPATKGVCLKSGNDPQFQSWYFNAYVVKRVKLVIVIDTSRYMAEIDQAIGVPRIAVLKEVIKDVINPLRDNDKFAVIAVSDNAYPLNGPKSDEVCFADALAQGTLKNKNKMFGFLDTVRASGGLDYGKGLSKAFEFLERSYDADEDVSRIIILVSGGRQEDTSGSLLEILKEKGNKLNDSVKLFAYGLGNGNFSFLEEITAYSKKITESGAFFAIPDLADISTILPYYYRHLPQINITEPLWSAPYPDSLDLGQVVTASIPVFVNNTRIGVVSLDVLLDDLMRESRYFKPNDFSYSFVIDGSGLVLQHPFYPSRPKAESFLVDITSIEQDAEYLSIYESMKRYPQIIFRRVVAPASLPSLLTRIIFFELLKSGENGSKSFAASRFVNSGSHPNNAVKKIKILSRYIWKKVPKANFSICLVLAINESFKKLDANGSIPPGSFLHDRLDLVPPKAPCTHGTPSQPFAAINQSSIFLAARTYTDPTVYMFRNFTMEDILSIARFMEGSGPNVFNIKHVSSNDIQYFWVLQYNTIPKGQQLENNSLNDSVPIEHPPESIYYPEWTLSPMEKITNENDFEQDILNGAKQDVVATYKAEILWNTVDEEEEFLRSNVLWRYIGTESGVFRLFPGVVSPKFYDPVLRPWYIDAQTYLESYVVTLPYFDFDSGDASKNRIITVCKALLKPSFDSDGKREIAAVMGADLFNQYFEGIFRDLYSIWTSSSEYKIYLTDSVGYLILADEYASNEEVKHLTELEPEVSSVLVASNILRRVNCSRVELGSLQRQYEMRFPSNQTQFNSIIQNNGGECQGFSLMAVPETNTFILVRATVDIGCENAFKGHAKTCQCSTDSSQKCKSSWEDVYGCECPCTDENPYYLPCSNTYEIKNKTYNLQPCALKTDISGYTDAVGVKHVPGLPSCYKLDLGLETDVSFSAIVLSSSLSVLLVIVLFASTIVCYLNKIKENEAKARAHAKVVQEILYQEDIKMSSRTNRSNTVSPVSTTTYTQLQR